MTLGFARPMHLERLRRTSYTQGRLLMSNVPPVSPEALDPIERLALSYAAPQARPAWEALLLFQHRLTDTARPGREPLMIQLRLSWWRDRLAEPAARWPKGEPLLARMAVWQAEAEALIGLVDGWEAKVVGEDGGATLATAQISAYVALARIVGELDEATVRVTAEHLLSPGVYQQTLPRLSRKMRPLSILRADAIRAVQGSGLRPLADFAVLMRVGLFGR